MLYPRTMKLDGRNVLVDDTQMTSYKEHMTQKHRILYLSGPITGEMDSQNLLQALDSLSHDPIKLFIASPGGDLDTTFLFINNMKMIKSPIITVGKYCASAACLILASGTERYLYTHAKTMLHLPAGQMGGDAKDWDIQHRQMVSYKNKIVDILVNAGAKRSKEEIVQDIDRDFWMEPEETIAYGLADGMMTSAKWLEFIGEKKCRQ